MDLAKLVEPSAGHQQKVFAIQQMSLRPAAMLVQPNSKGRSCRQQ
ncbi:hypothetical protein [Methylomonas sp. Kb3]|nr:hypothetical protein [Methylomonas sp. Kb3]